MKNKQKWSDVNNWVFKKIKKYSLFGEAKILCTCHFLATSFILKIFDNKGRLVDSSAFSVYFKVEMWALLNKNCLNFLLDEAGLKIFNLIKTHAVDWQNLYISCQTVKLIINTLIKLSLTWQERPPEDKWQILVAVLTR